MKHTNITKDTYYHTSLKKKKNQFTAECFELKKPSILQKEQCKSCTPQRICFTAATQRRGRTEQLFLVQSTHVCVLIKQKANLSCTNI